MKEDVIARNLGDHVLFLATYKVRLGEALILGPVDDTAVGVGLQVRDTLSRCRAARQSATASVSTSRPPAAVPGQPLKHQRWLRSLCGNQRTLG